VRYGLFSINAGACTDPEVAVRIARAAEDAGFDSVWTGEHVVLPDPRVAPAPMNPEDPILDPVVSLSYIAARTERLRLGTGIIILPQRNPLVLAKEIATLDVLSGGRTIIGVAAGYLEPEFDAVGAQFEARGPRTVEYIAAMRAIWSEQRPAAFSGRFARFGGVSARPLPLQKPYPPIVMGGHSPMAFRRAVACTEGWYGFALDLEATEKCIAGLRAAAASIERPAALGPLEISVSPRGPVTPDVAESFAKLGVSRLILLPPGRADADALESFVSNAGQTLVGG
jgi:probable F420-dependent oxidoreductase